MKRFRLATWVTLPAVLLAAGCAARTRLCRDERGAKRLQVGRRIL